MPQFTDRDIIEGACHISRHPRGILEYFFRNSKACDGMNQVVQTRDCEKPYPLNYDGLMFRSSLILPAKCKNLLEFELAHG